MVDISKERLAELEASEEENGSKDGEINELITLVIDMHHALEMCRDGKMDKEEVADVMRRASNVLGEVE